MVPLFAELTSVSVGGEVGRMLVLFAGGMLDAGFESSEFSAVSAAEALAGKGA